ncbi:MAG: type I-C CRISPR-associated protein Cas8c/Csd1 [Coriobacteriales bacterium]|jgi:CRISPR-associated protein Csd1|nr:type I-C CRISPR-associated protein Cas8c/Csd1 [Coriobacteriales bacterium]
MILQALVKRYEDCASSGEAIAYGWESRNVKYAIDLSKDGALLGVVSLGSENKGLSIQLPQAAKRTSGIAPSFLCDNAQYFFGIFDENKAEKENKLEKRRGDAKKAFESARNYHRQILNESTFLASPNASAIVKWFDAWKPELATENKVVKNIFADEKSKKVFLQGLFVFQVNGRFVNEDEEIKDAWSRWSRSPVNERIGDENRAADKILCLVTGQHDEVARLHGAVGLRGAQATAAFISVNAASFASYGKTEKDPAAPISKQAEFKYRTALKNLLHDKNHHQFVGGDTVVYWAENGGESEAETFSFSMSPTEDDTGKLRGLMDSVMRGKMVDMTDLDFARTFYLLGLSPNRGRISVRFFLADTFGNILKNVVEHYNNLEIIAPKNDRFTYLPPWVILSETTVSKKTKDASPLLGGQLLTSIITGKPYPMSLYHAMLIRVRANEHVSRTKAAIIKAVLMRNCPATEREVLTVSLNPNSDNKPYVLGRLFAVLEQLQISASGGMLNATIRDRYFASACANPRSVFPTLLKLSMHHAAKSDYAVRYEKLKEELLDKLDVEAEPFPAALSLDDQGRFILGYYHQMQDLFTSKKVKEPELKEDNNDE